MTSHLPFVDADAIADLVSPADAVEMLRSTLAAGFRPEDDHARIFEPLSHGEFLFMPSETPANTGVKVLTVTPSNADRDLPRIQGIYLLLDGETHAPRCLVDGPALTDLRTPAVSLAAVVDALTASHCPLDVVLYGAGHQGLGHLRTVRDVLAGRREIGTVTAIVRNPERVETGQGLDHIDRVLAAGSEEAREATAAAGLIMCTTTARTPLFDGDLVRDDAVVVAVGSHETEARELPGSLMGRALVVVEDVATALRECGDVVLAIEEGHLREDDLVPMADVVTGARRIDHSGRPVVFKSSGMSWEDLVVAAAIAQRAEDR